MGMKFLNKKGWHTGSLRNIENVWKAEQKDEAEKRKLEELRKQIHEERERDEFRQLQEQAGFTPRQERLEFLYDSGLSVGKTSNEGFSALQSCPPAAQTSNSASASAAQPPSSNIGPGALFEEKPQSANDSWRKLHSDPLLMIRQREQEALARIKNNPVKMAMIRKSVETKKKDDEAHDGKKKRVKSKHKRHSSSKHDEDDSDDDEQRKKGKSNHKAKKHLVSDEDSSDQERHHTHPRKDSSDRRNGNPVNRRQDRNEGHEHLDTDKDSRDRRNGSSRNRRQDRNEGHEHLDTVKDSRDRRNGSPGNRRRDRNEKLSHGKYPSDSQDDKSTISDIKHAALPPKPESHRRRGRAPQLSEEERAARLREMQMDAELHEENRWKRLKKAEEEDAKEASKATISRGGGSFLDTVHKSVYGAEKGGSSTIEESVRRRSHFLQGRTQVDEQNAFRR